MLLAATPSLSLSHSDPAPLHSHTSPPCLASPPRSPSLVSKLDLALEALGRPAAAADALQPEPPSLEATGAKYVDLALQVPGFWFYAKDSDAEKRAGQRRLSISKFFSMQHYHGGGMYKKYFFANEQRRQHLIASNRRPSYRPGYTRRSLAQRLVGGTSGSSGSAAALKATQADLHYLFAPVLKAFMVYNETYHESSLLLKSSLGSTVGSIMEGACEVRYNLEQNLWQRVRNHSVATPRFFMRGEARFHGPGLEEVLQEHPPQGGLTRAEAKHEYMQHILALLFYYQVEYLEVRPFMVPSFASVPVATEETALRGAMELLNPITLELANVDITLGLLVHHLGVQRTTSLASLDLDMLLSLHRSLARCRAMSFCLTAEEAALLDATEHLQGLCNHTRNLARAKGSLRAERRATKQAAVAAAAASATDNPPEEPPPPAVTPPPPREASSLRRPPKPRSLHELWLAVAQSFATADELRAVMKVVGLRITRPNKTRFSRPELETSFAQKLSTTKDVVARRLALRMAPELEEELNTMVDEEEEGDEALEEEGPAAADGDDDA